MLSIASTRRRRDARIVGLLVALITLAGVLAGPARAAYEPKTPPLTTPWTSQVSTTAPLPEYPRPQMVRSEWRSLNGQWQWAPAVAGEGPPIGRALAETILVPFPEQSALSGIMRQVQRSWYRRAFEVPAAWRGRRVLLHFGAVTHRATVWVNGRQVGAHTGSYDAWAVDVTDALRPGGPNELVVGVADPLAYGGGQPVGKQSVIELSVVHTASSGIWQSVWLEPVAPAHVERVDTEADLRRDRALVTVRARGAAGTTVVLRARDGRRVVATTSGRPGRRLALRVPRPKLWSPERPFLYGLDVELRRGARRVDRVRSYFGMRSIGLKRVGGVVRPVLNGRFVFQIGPLDQAYWPEGLYTAPTDAALRFDVAEAKKLGFNMIRKHVKVDSARWYYWADRLGMLVWQDMPNMSIYRRGTPADKAPFERELRAMIDQHRSSPAIVTWVPFNEGWGEYDAERITREVKAYDPTRLVNGHSGSANCCLADEPRSTDLRDAHLYQGPFAPKPDARASTIGEFGVCNDTRALGDLQPRPAPPGTPLTAGGNSVRANRGAMRQGWAALEQAMRTPGLSAAVFTAWTNVEHEVNGGLLSYDRRVRKCATPELPRLNRALIAASRREASLRPQSPAIPRGSSGLWTFDRAAGRSVPDASGHGHPLRLLGGARLGAGLRGGGLLVDGRGARAQASGRVVDTQRSYTVSAWLRVPDARQSASAVSQGAAFSLGLRWANDRPDLDAAYPLEGLGVPHVGRRFSFSVQPTTACTRPDCAVRANAGYGDARQDARPRRWTHVVGTVTRANRTASVYIDGEPVDGRTLERALPGAGRFAVGVGQLGNAGRDAFRGQVDLVRTYARALTPAEVYRLHAAEAGDVRRAHAG